MQYWLFIEKKKHYKFQNGNYILMKDFCHKMKLNWNVFSSKLYIANKVHITKFKTHRNYLESYGN